MTESHTDQHEHRSSPLITVDELERRLRDPHLTTPTILDVRWSLGTPAEKSRQEHLEEHLPGAVFVDLAAALSGPPREDGAGGRHPMPTAEQFQSSMRALGVSRGRPVVVYDTGPGLAAARAWWMLTHFGADDVRVLDGGLQAWTADGLATESGGSTPNEGDFVAAPGHRPLVTAEDVGRRVADPDSAEARARVLIDARPAERFLGSDEAVDPIPGHIPGAANLPALELIAQAGDLIGDEGIAAAFAHRGAGPSTPPTLSCGSGVQACHLALAWELAYPDADPAEVYIGSWSDWISAGDRPVARG